MQTNPLKKPNEQNTTSKLSTQKAAFGLKLKKTDIQRPTSLEPAKFAEAQPVGQHGWRTGGALGQYKNPGLNRCQMWFPFLHPAEWLFIPPNSLDWVSSRPTIQSKNRF